MMGFRHHFKKTVSLCLSVLRCSSSVGNCIAHSLRVCCNSTTYSVLLSRCHVKNCIAPSASSCGGPEPFSGGLAGINA